jgi:hypothetical protein
LQAALQKLDLQEGELLKAQQDLTQAQQALAQREAELQKIQGDLASVQQEREKLNAELLKTKQGLAQIQQERDSLEVELQKIQQELAKTQNELAICWAAQVIITPQPEPVALGIQDEPAETPIPEQGWSSFQIIGIMASVMVNALVLLILVLILLRTTDKSQHIRQYAARTAERPLRLKPVTVKMNHQAYQSYLEYLRNHKK